MRIIATPLYPTIMAFEITKGESGKMRQKLQTRAGLRVIAWRFVRCPNETFFPIRATIEMPDGTTEEHPYTRSGRRYINVESAIDLVPAVEPKEQRERERLDCMPDVLRAIECVRNKDMSGVRSANKDNVIWKEPTYGEAQANIEIGSIL